MTLAKELYPDNVDLLRDFFDLSNININVTESICTSLVEKIFESSILDGTLTKTSVVLKNCEQIITDLNKIRISSEEEKNLVESVKSRIYYIERGVEKIRDCSVNYNRKFHYPKSVE